MARVASFWDICLALSFPVPASEKLMSGTPVPSVWQCLDFQGTPVPSDRQCLVVTEICDKNLKKVGANVPKRAYIAKIKLGDPHKWDPRCGLGRFGCDFM